MLIYEPFFFFEKFFAIFCLVLQAKLRVHLRCELFEVNFASAHWAFRLWAFNDFFDTGKAKNVATRKLAREDYELKANRAVFFFVDRFLL